MDLRSSGFLSSSPGTEWGRRCVLCRSLNARHGAPELLSLQTSLILPLRTSSLTPFPHRRKKNTSLPSPRLLLTCVGRGRVFRFKWDAGSRRAGPRAEGHTPANTAHLTPLTPDASGGPVAPPCSCPSFVSMRRHERVGEMFHHQGRSELVPLAVPTTPLAAHILFAHLGPNHH